MTNKTPFFLSISAGIVLGIAFGLWQENYYAGYFMGTASFYYFSLEE